jgi:hypothetical protein
MGGSVCALRFLASGPRRPHGRGASGGGLPTQVHRTGQSNLARGGCFARLGGAVASRGAAFGQNAVAPLRSAVAMLLCAMPPRGASTCRPTPAALSGASPPVYGSAGDCPRSAFDGSQDRSWPPTPDRLGLNRFCGQSSLNAAVRRAAANEPRQCRRPSAAPPGSPRTIHFARYRRAPFGLVHLSACRRLR